MTLLSVCAAFGDDLPTRDVTYDFVGIVMELTIDSMPDIHGMRIKIRKADGTLGQLLDKKDFTDWQGGVTRFAGIVQMGSDVDIITVATGTGTGMYYLHKYRIEDDKAKLIKSERIYDWGLRPPKDELITGKKKSLVLQQDTNNLWNVHFDTE